MTSITMDDYGDEEEKLVTDEEELSSPEEGFMQGYMDDGEVGECAECGVALTEEKRTVTKSFEEEAYFFCSESCASDFKDSL